MYPFSGIIDWFVSYLKALLLGSVMLYLSTKYTSRLNDMNA
jgi:hypothetical protein